jgi:glycosyltransferase involved in cell wall biosynthesis
MKIVQIVAGSGGTFYCENCLRDSLLAKSLHKKGHDAVLVPLYLPMYAGDPATESNSPVFFGGINTYLQQKLPVFRKTPRWLDRLFDSRWLLKMAAKQAGTVSAGGMGPMTLSMIRGEAGNQAKELERLVAWLRDSERPDVIHITNVMLIGAARRLKEELGVPIVCVLQDEDTWLDALDGEYGELCWNAIRKRVADVDLFVSVSNDYAQSMQKRLGVSSDKIRTVYVGLDLAEFPRATLTLDPPVIGYLSKMTPSLGLGDLVDAFISLKKREELSGLKLKAIGGMVGPDKKFVQTLISRLAAEGMEGDAEFIAGLEKDAHARFLESISVMSVPMHSGGAFGTFMVEAWASGVPVVQPGIGAFPELVELSGGGLIYDAGSKLALGEALATILTDQNTAQQLGRAGRTAAETHFSIGAMTDNMLAVYSAVLG